MTRDVSHVFGMKKRTPDAPLPPEDLARLRALAATPNLDVVMNVAQTTLDRAAAGRSIRARSAERIRKELDRLPQRGSP